MYPAGYIQTVRRLKLSAVLSLALFACLPASGEAAELQAGAGRSDLTPPTGFATMGYVRSDAVARGVHTRLLARTIVLRRGATKIALVTTDLGFTPGGLVADVAAALEDRGFSDRDLVVSASHTHSGPAGFSNFGADNFVAPTTGTPTQFSVSTDPQLYGFLVDRVALSIARADDDLGPARAGWGRTRLLGVTDNRSIEAHLADHSLDLPPGGGDPALDPGGYAHTIDPEVDVLRVDRVRRGRAIPLGAWMNFADHGTVNPYTFGVYNGDHTASASRVFERRVRRIGRVPRGLEVVGAYGNADAGDMTAGLRGRGPAFAEQVGTAEARAMLRAWRRAGRHTERSPSLDVRWTRRCFCGRTVDGAPVDEKPIVGLPFLTGSEENRGPLFDVDGVSHEGDRLPVGLGPQGRKIQTIRPPVGDFAPAYPLSVIRVGDGALATVPGEMTAELGRRTRAAVLAALRPAGVKGVALAGYANEYLHYFTTPEEYDQQHYEGGSTLYGRASGALISSDLARLAANLAGGETAPEPVAFDPRNGVTADKTPYGFGAEAAVITAQPGRVAARLERARMAWQGGERGLDRPLDRSFVTVQRRGARRWRTVTNDLGLQILWRVGDDGVYTAEWQIPLAQRHGRYRFVVTANRYRLASRPFRVRPSRALRLEPLGSGRVRIAYPEIDPSVDLNHRPRFASGGVIRARAPGARMVQVRRRRGTIFSLPPGATVRAGAARDRFGNRSAVAFAAR